MSQLPKGVFYPIIDNQNEIIVNLIFFLDYYFDVNSRITIFVVSN